MKRLGQYVPGTRVVVEKGEFADNAASIHLRGDAPPATQFKNPCGHIREVWNSSPAVRQNSVAATFRQLAEGGSNGQEVPLREP